MSSPFDPNDPIAAAIHFNAMRAINEIVARMNTDLLQYSLRLHRQERDQYTQPTLWEAA